MLFAAKRNKTERSEPRYLYKIVSSASPVREPLPERLPVSDVDNRSGFIHLSTAKQVPITLKSWFDDEPLVYVLRLYYGAVKDEIQWEEQDAKALGPRYREGLFPVRCLSTLSYSERYVLFGYSDA